MKRPRDELNDNGSNTSGKTTGAADGPPATTDTNGPKMLKRPSETPLMRASCKMFKADLTSTTRSRSQGKTPLASAMGVKNMTDLSMLRKEHEAARQTRLVTMAVPVPHNDDMDMETEDKKRKETKVKEEKKTTKDTEEKGEKSLDDLLASIYDYNKLYNSTKK